MKNKFTKKHKNVLIIKGTQGMAKLSLAVVYGLFKTLLSSTKLLISSAPCARMLSFFGVLLQKIGRQVSSTSCARALSLLGAQAVAQLLTVNCSLSTVLASCARALSGLWTGSVEATTGRPTNKYIAGSTSCARALSQLCIYSDIRLKTKDYSLTTTRPSCARALSLLGILVITVSVFILSPFTVHRSPFMGSAQAATSNTLNFQGRLLTASGGLVPDGIYNMQFDLYYVSSGGSTQWTEDRLVTNTQGVTVQNGYYSVYLGEYDTIPALDWGSDIYLGMTIRGTTNCAWGACSPADAEMTPRFKLTAVPYAFRSANVASSNTNAVSTNSDAVSITTGNALGATSSSGNISIATGSGTTNSGNITIDAGNGTGSDGTISLGSANASALTLGRTGLTTVNTGGLTVTQLLSANGNLTIAGGTDFGVYYRDGSDNVVTTAAGATNECFRGVTGSAPIWGTCAGTGDIVQNGNSFTAVMTIGTNDAYDLQLEVNNTVALTIDDATQNVTLVGDLAVNGDDITSDADLTVTPAGGQVIIAGDLEVTAGNYLSLAGGNTASRPGSPTEGMVYFDSDTDSLLTYANGKWQSDRGEFVVVAANDSTQAEKDSADYVADGTADQTEINSALTAGAGGKVILLAGTYVANATILIPNNTTLAGSGPGTVIEIADIDATDNLIENSDTTTGTGVVIRDLKLDGRNDLNTLGSQQAIYLNAMGADGTRQGAQLLNLTIENFRSHGISLLNSDTNLISGSTIRDVDDGVLITSSTSNTISNNIIDQANLAIELDTTSNDIISGNRVTNTNDALFFSTNFNLNISNNVFIGTSSGDGINFDDTSYSVISGNTIDGYDYGLDIYGDSDHNIFTGNTIINNDNSLGLELSSSADSNIISSNRFSNNGGATANNAINISSDNNTISGNVITDNSCTTTCYAITISASADRNYLIDNTYRVTAGTDQATINDLGTNTRYASQLTPSAILQSGSSLIKANATSVLTGSIDPAASTAVVGVGTKFTTELQVGDRITVTGETRTVTVITDDINLDVDTAFSNNANDVAPDRLPAALVVQNSAGVNQLVVADNGAVTITNTLAVNTLGSTDTATFLCRNIANQLAGCNYSPLNASLTDNIADALDIQEGTNNYININTTNSSENISFGNATTNPSYNFLGSGTLAVAGSQTIGGDLAVNGGDITSTGDLTITPAGGDLLLTGNLDVSGTLFAGTGDAFQVSSAGAVTAVGVNAGAGLLQGQLGLTVTGAAVSLNASSNFDTNINTGNSTGAVNIGSGTGANAIGIGNSASTTTVLGITNINTTGTAATSIGNSGAVTTLTGSSILLNSATLQRTAAGTTSLDLVDGANTTLALLNSGAGVANLTVDGSITVATLGATDNASFLCRNTSNILAGCNYTPLNPTLADNITDALDIQEGTNNYFNINTTNASENISFGNATTNPSYSFLGSGTLTVTGPTTVNGLLTATLGATVSGATVNLNASSNNATNINTGTSTGAVTIGGGSGTFALDSTAFDVTTAGALSGITTISTSSTINSQTISSAANFTGTLAVNGATATIGTASTTNGGLVLLNSTNAFGVTIQASGQLVGNATIQIPNTAGANDTFCLATIGNCSGLGGLQSSYNAGNTITTTNARDIDFTLADTATDSNFDIVVASGSSSAFRIYNNATLAVSYDTTNGFSVPGTGVSSQRFGYGSSATGTGDLAVGRTASASGDWSTAVGNLSVSTVGGIALGYNASGTGAIAIGYNSSASTQSVAIGASSVATVGSGVAVGQSAVGGDRGTALGHSATTAGTNDSIALGQGATVTGSNQLVIGGGTYGGISNAYIGKGVTNASPSAFTLNSTGGSGTDIAGANFTLAGGRGTGTGTGGSLLFQTATAGASGASLNALTTRLTIDQTGLATFANNLAVSGNTDVAGTLFAGTADAFQVSSGGAVTAVGVNSGAGLLQGQLGLTVTGATANINSSSNFDTNINTGTSTGAVNIANGSGANAIGIGNSASTTTILGATNINVTGATTTTIGNATAALNINGTTTLAAGFSQTGANTFSTGTGAISLNGATSVTGTNTLTVGTGLTSLGGGLSVTAGNTTLTADLTVNGNTTIGDAASDNLTVTASILGANALVFEGATDGNGFATTLQVTDPTANNTIVLPDASGTVQLAPSSGSFIKQVPASTAENTITPTANSVVGLTVNGTSGTATTALAVSQPGAAAGITIASANNTATNGLSFSGTFTNYISATNLTVTNAGNADFAGTLTSGTADAFQVNATGAVTAVGVNSGAGLLQGQLGLTVTGAAVSLNASSNFDTNINTGNSTGSVNIANGSGANAIGIGNSASTTTVLGATNINTTGATTTTIGNATSALNINGTTTVAAGFSQTGANSFSTGTGAISLNGATSVTGTNTLTVGTGLTSLGGALTVTGLTTLNGGLTVEAGDTFTFNSDAFTDLTGAGLSVVGNALTVDITSATGAFVNGGNTFGGTATLGTNDGNILSLETTNTSRFQIAAASATLTGQGATTLTSTAGLTVDSAAALSLGNTNATSIAVGRSGITTTVTGGLTQLTGAVSLTGNAASSFTTSSGNTTIDSAAVLNLGNTTATAITLGRTGVTTTNAGALTVTQLLTGNLGATISGATANINASSDFNTNINTGTSNGTVAIGNSLSTTTVLGATNINVTGATTTTIGSATSALNINGTTTIAAGFSQTGANTFSTGTGAISLNGATSVTGTNTLTVGTGLTSLGGALTVTGTGTFNGIVAIGDAVTDNLTILSAIQGANALIFDGATDNTNEITLAITDPGADFTITLPAETGTICTTGSICAGYASTVGYATISLNNIASTNLSSALNVTSGNLALTTTTSGDITLTPALGTGLVNILTGNLQIGNGAPGVVLNGEDVYIEGTLEVDGAQQFDGALVATSTAAFNGNLTVGDAIGDTVTINSGAWTFANDTTFALTGGINALNFDSNTLSVDATNNRIGIGTAAPTVSLDVVGRGLFTDTTNTDTLTVTGNSVTTTNVLQINATGLTTGEALRVDATGNNSSGQSIGQSIHFTNKATGGSSRALELNFTQDDLAVTSSEALAYLYLVPSTNTTDTGFTSAITINNGDTSATGSTVITRGIYFVCGGGITACFTNEFVLQNGETIDNATDGTIQLTATTTALSGNLDTAGTIFAGTGNAFQVSSGGAVTAVGVNSGAGLLQGQLGLTVTGAAISLNDSSNFATTINTGTSTGAVTIGNTSNAANAVTLAAGSTGYVNFNATQAQFTEVTGTRTLTVQTRTSAGVAGSSLTVQAGSASSAAGAASVGGVLTLQGGTANGTSGAANGGNVVISGGTGYSTGVKGLVVIDTATYSAATVQNFTANANITQANIDTYGSLLISGNVAGWVATLTDPTTTTSGRVIYITNSGSVDITLGANAVGVALSISLKPASTATMYWNGVDWTAAGASSSTDLQAAYDNTATSAGGAEIVLSSAGTGGLTIRNDDTTAITGGLLEVQTSIGSNLFTVNNNATEYASNGGAESATFTAWAAAPAGGTVTRYTTVGDNIATGVGSAFVDTTSTVNTGAKNTLSASLTANLKYKVSYTARHTSSTATFTTLETYFSNDGTTAHVECGTDTTIYYNKWTRVDCTFTPTSVGASNAIFFRHTDAVEHDFYIDNFSVTVDASSNHAVDGDVDSALGTNWQAYDADGGAGTSTPTRDTSNIYNTSGAVAVATAGPAANLGVRNNLTITPSISTQYLVTFYAKLASGTFTDITVGFLPAGGSGTPVAAQLCTDYNTQTLSTSSWTKITCIMTTPSSGISDPDLVIYQPTSAARTFYVDALRITLNTNNSSNVQVGGGQKGGPTTLFTLDRSYGAPIADNNDAYLGSMYYDTSTGRIQCYEADGWGACGAAPDNIVNLNPEYAGAVLNGTGVGTMTADFCSDDTALTVNASLCDTGQAKNYYKWTSPQATQQTYSIYVTYQLPATFNGFSSDDTVQLVARTDSLTNAAVTYEMFKSTGSAVTACGTETTVVTTANTWQSVGINGNESTGCSFSSSSASNFIIFKINTKANSNANAYVSTLSFTTTGR